MRKLEESACLFPIVLLLLLTLRSTTLLIDSYRYSRKDRRPLDPPPVAELQLLEITPSEIHVPRTGEIEILPDNDVSGDGIVCLVDLFPVPDQQTEPANPVAGPSTHASSSKELYSPADTTSSDPFEFFRLDEASFDGHLPPPHADSPSVGEEDRVVAIYGDQPITEGSKLDALAGTSTVHSNLLQFENRERIMFVYSVRNYNTLYFHPSTYVSG